MTTIKSSRLHSTGYHEGSGVYFGKFEIEFDDDRLDDLDRAFGHKITLDIRFADDDVLSYAEIREKFIREAESLLSLSHAHLLGKKWSELNQCNIEFEEQDKPLLDY